MSDLWRKTKTLRKSVFSYKYASLIAPGLFFTGLGVMLESDRFLIAGITTAVSCLCFLGWWTSDTRLKHNSYERNKKKANLSNRKKFAGIVAAFIICGAFIAWDYALARAFGLRLMSGYLLPDGDDTPADCFGPLPNGTLAFYLGDSVIHPSHFPSPVLIKVDRTPVMTIEKSKDGDIALDLDVRSEDGKIVARIERNRFIVNPNNFLEMQRPDRSSLIVKDQHGDEVVNLKYLNGNAIHFTGAMYVPGVKDRIVITEHDQYLGKGKHIAQACSSIGAPDIEFVVE